VDADPTTARRPFWKGFLPPASRGEREGKEGQPDLRDLLVLGIEENRADQAVPHSSPTASICFGAPAPSGALSQVGRFSSKVLVKTSHSIVFPGSEAIPCQPTKKTELQSYLPSLTEA
jgi:hypothetical protein